MRQKELHLSDEVLLLAADGELSSRRAKKVRAHLAECWSCRAKLAEMEAAIGKFVRFHRETSDCQLPPARASRARLESQLARLAAAPDTTFWVRLRHLLPSPRAAAYACLMLAVAAAAGRFWWQHSTRIERLSSAGLAQPASMLPDSKLTPGAIRPVAVSEVCAMAHEEVELDVPSSLREKVFREYGMVRPRAENYEIDYLITPGLGGTEDIHNLWPEPYRSVVWNARVKDTLEERMHQMVCSGNLDLSTAQNDIAKDWIAAYKKYFHTDEPLGINRQMDLSLRETARVDFDPRFHLGIAVAGDRKS
jgi:Putative zinc-finger